MQQLTVVLTLSILMFNAEGQNPSFSKCNQHVINQIKNYWWRNGGAPLYVTANKDLHRVILATPSTFAGEKCAASQFGEQAINGLEFITLMNLKIFDENCCYTERVQPVRDVEGGAQYTDYTVKALYLFNEGGVSCAYICNSCANATNGGPDAFVKVNPSYYDRTLVHKCLKAFSEFNPPIYLTAEYPISCPCTKYDCRKQCNS